VEVAMRAAMKGRGLLWGVAAAGVLAAPAGAQVLVGDG
jgi:hypothetical protein